jgi:nucleoside-diphosphate-sugar epimerase
VIGNGGNYVSSLHVHDAGAAVAAALDAPGGVYNLGDDQPVTALEWTSPLAAALGAPPPRRLPGWLARLVLGGAAGLFTVSQRVSNRRFCQATGWRPRHPSVEAGWPTLAAPAGPAQRQVA